MDYQKLDTYYFRFRDQGFPNVYVSTFRKLCRTDNRYSVAISLVNSKFGMKLWTGFKIEGLYPAISITMGLGIMVCVIILLAIDREFNHHSCSRLPQNCENVYVHAHVCLYVCLSVFVHVYMYNIYKDTVYRDIYVHKCIHVCNVQYGMVCAFVHTMSNFSFK